MPNFRNPLLIGAAALALIGASVPAWAGDDQPHMMTLTMPDGSIARIAYTGDVPPRVVLAPAPAFAPITASAFNMPALDMLQQVSAAMERQADMMLRQVAALPTLTQTGVATLQPGVHVYTMEATITANGACTRRTEVSYAGNGAAPREVSNVSGECGPAPQRATEPASGAHDQPQLIQVHGQPEYRQLVTQAQLQTHF